MGTWIAANPSDTDGFHYIVSNDWFVALPNPERSSSDTSWTNSGNGGRVRVSYNLTNDTITVNRSIIAPVWDVGPWNKQDDYWNVDDVRNIYAIIGQYWQTPGAAPDGPPPGWNQPSTFPTPAPSLVGTSSAPLAFGPLGQGNPEAFQAWNTTAKDGTGTITVNTYNYGCDQSGRTVFSSGLNGAGIDVSAG